MAMALALKLEYLYEMPLKDLAARRVAIILCSCPRILLFSCGMKNESKLYYEGKRDDMLSAILASFVLPESTKKELISLMKPISREVIKWINFHERFLQLKSNVLSNLFVLNHIRWTRLGTVNYKETAKALMYYQTLSVELRYKLACLYCFVEDIRNLWKQIPVLSKKNFYGENPLIISQTKIVVIWTFIIKNKRNELRQFLVQGNTRYHTIYQYAFEHAAKQGYRTTTQYFFEKLTRQEKNESLVRTAYYVAGMRSFDFFTYVNEYQKYTDVLFYLLSQMHDFYLIRFYNDLPFESLKCFLDWPRQESFIKHAKHVFEWSENFTEEQYCKILFILSRNISSGYHYLELHRSFFLMSPQNYKDFALAEYAFFVRETLRIGDHETINFIFSCLNPDEKIQFAFAILMVWLAPAVVATNWGSIKRMIYESGLSEENKNKLVSSFHSLIPKNLRCFVCGSFYVKELSNEDKDKLIRSFFLPTPENQRYPLAEKLIKKISDIITAKCDKSAQDLQLSALNMFGKPSKMQKV